VYEGNVHELEHQASLCDWGWCASPLINFQLPYLTEDEQFLPEVDQTRIAARGLLKEEFICEVLRRGDTALHVAIRVRRKDVARWLLGKGASFQIRNAENETAADVALAQGPCMERLIQEYTAR